MRHDGVSDPDSARCPVARAGRIPALDASMAPDSIVELRTTFGSRSAAEVCARMLVDRRLAACCQIEGPIHATYRWQGCVEAAEEYRVVCKTVAELVSDAGGEIVRIHAYACPEILSVTVEASHAYAAWVRDSVTPPVAPPPSGSDSP